MRLVLMGLVAALLVAPLDARTKSPDAPPPPGTAPATAPATTTPPNSPARIQQCAAARDAALAPAIARQTQSCAYGGGPKCDSARANLVSERARLTYEYNQCVARP